MDNRLLDFTGLDQMEKQYRHREKVVKTGFPSLMAYGAALAANGENERLSQFQKLMKYMIRYWYPDDRIAKKGEVTKRECLARLDHKIADARATGQAPILSDDEKKSLLDSLATHIRTVLEEDPGPNIVEYQRLQAELKETWSTPRYQQQMGGMTFG